MGYAASGSRKVGRYPAVDLLAVVLRRLPSLPGALCRGRSRLFDSEDPAVAAEAIALCQRCPELHTCRAWVGTLTPKSRPSGVVAGRLYRTRVRGELVSR